MLKHELHVRVTRETSSTKPRAVLVDCFRNKSHDFL